MAQQATPEANISITDEEEYVDKRIKKRILDSRERVNDREDTLFNESLLDPEISVSQNELTVAWGNTVRQFLRDIEVLMLRLDIETSQNYYTGVDLGSVTLTPPDTQGYQFSRVVEDVEETLLRQQLGLPPSADLPEPERIEFRGLQSVIERDSVLSARWSVLTRDGGTPADREYVSTQTARPIPKYIWENAVRAADRYLHDAGVGVTAEPNPYRSEEPGL